MHQTTSKPTPVPVPYSAVAAAERALTDFTVAVVKRVSLSIKPELTYAEDYLLGVLHRNLREAQVGHREWQRIEEWRRIERTQ